jgi:UDPglucose--hexose-1-phosphate uridylyltransferase
VIDDTPKMPVKFCPFCPHNEHMTPPEIFATEDRRIRIVPNKYPFITVDDESFGVHDVLIDTADHEQVMADFSDEHMYSLMQVIRNRTLQLEADERISYVQVFKNQGKDAGASQSHSHWQIAALSVVPLKMEHLLEVLGNFYKDNGKCYFCQMDFGTRIIEENEHFLSYMPADAKFAYEMDILPKRHISSITEFTEEELASFGKLLRNSVKRLGKVYEGVSYNVCFYSAPKNVVKSGNKESFHFYAQIFPRIGHMAGFEFSTGCYINSILPEVGAETLRKIELD